jgi:hypothetical protein
VTLLMTVALSAVAARAVKGSPISAPCREIKRHRPKFSLGCCPSV